MTGGGTTRLIETDEPAIAVFGLRNGVKYSFEVFAVTGAGRSEGAGPVSATPRTGMEDAVAGLIVEFTDPSLVEEGDSTIPGEERLEGVEVNVGEKVSDDAVLVELAEPVDLETAEQLAKDLAADEDVAWAEPDQFLFTAAESSPESTIATPPLASPVSVPLDSDYAASQWNLWDAYGISIGDGTTAMTDAWAGPRGEGVTVAVIDTGITPHPDLDSRLVSGFDFVSSPEQLSAPRQADAVPVAFDGDYVDTAAYGALGRDGNPADPGDWRGVAPVRDSSWHGTHVAGIIAARLNTEGITGIAPGARIQPIRALSWRGGLLSDIAASITWASGGAIDGVGANPSPSKVINMSFAVETSCPVALQEAIDGAAARGSILVAAAGNAADDATKFTPGNCNGVITVGATNRDGHRADYSNYGDAVDISAPGGDPTNAIVSTSNSGSQEPAAATTAGEYGTSVAAAHVSAAAALLASRESALSPRDAYALLTGRSYTKDFANKTCDSTDTTVTCGSGILTLALVQIAAGACVAQAPYSITDSGVPYTVVKFNGAGTCSWTPPAGVTNVEVLAVGGGGGGGAWVGGGGGGGGVVVSSQSVTPGTPVTVTVGAGGTGASTTDGSITVTNATSGGASSFGSISAAGGGRGGSYSAYAPAAGGSGGGGSNGNGAAGNTPSTSPAQGNAGGNAQPAELGYTTYATGGGGGAGEAGGNYVNVNTSGPGGAGRTSTFSGTSVVYGGGGGGGVHGIDPVPGPGNNPGAGGSGGGGAGNGYKSTGCTATLTSGTTCVGGAGTDGLGGGGGGSGGPLTNDPNTAVASQGGVGGAGVLMVRYSSGLYCNIGFTELNFDYANSSNLVGTGFNVGDKVRFGNVATKTCNGVSTIIDAVVTTSTLVGSTILKYENGARAGGDNSFFQVDTRVTVPDGYAEFTFAFYKAGTSQTVPVILQNITSTGVDIDDREFIYYSGFDSYTLATDTRLTLNPTPTSFPATTQFVGATGSLLKVPQDQVSTTYGEVDTFVVRVGRQIANSTYGVNYFGWAFKELTWGTATPQTTGAQYTLTYAANGATSGTVPASQTGGVGAIFTTRTNTGSLVKTGYTFAGWNTAADGSGTTYLAGSSIAMPLNGATLYALWTPLTFTLSYSANGGATPPASQTSGYGTSVTVSGQLTMTRPGYVFAGWNTAANGSGSAYAAGASYTITGNSTLYAVWNPSTVTVTYDANGGTGAPSLQTGTAGSLLTLSSTRPTRTGYTFTGWNTAIAGSGTTYAPGASITLPVVNVTLYAQWTVSRYTLSYNLNGGSGAAPSAQTGAYNTTVLTATPTATRSGYTFSGWYTNASGSGGTAYAAGATFTLTADAILYAQWTPVSYTLTYDANSGLDAPSSQSGTAGASLTLSGTQPTRSGYTFNGWNTLAAGTGTAYVSGATFLMPVGGATLYAQWTANAYVVTYNPNGGSGEPGSAVSSTGSTVTVSSSLPTRTGYTFTGWNTAANGSGTSRAASSTFTMPASDVTLYAQWTPVSYTLSYNANGGSGAPASSTVNYAATATVSATVPTRAGYWFNGWNTLSNGTGASYASSTTFTMVGNVTLYAQWVADAYRVVYSANGGENPPAEQVLATDTTVTVAGGGAPMTRAGYTFTSWNTGADGSGTGYAPTDTFLMPASNTTLYAQWTPVNYTVTYNANSGSGAAPAAQTATYLSTVTVKQPTPLSRIGYTFSGWNTLANGTGTGYTPDEDLLMPAANVTLYARWVADNFNVIYNANGGEAAPSPDDYAVGSTVTVASALLSPTRTGYTFTGWNTLASGAGTSRPPSSAFTMPAGDVTLYAQWSVVSYALSYSANGGAGAPGGQSVNYGATATIAAGLPTRSGYTFTGWNTNASGTGTAYASSATFPMPASNVTLYAMWTATTYELTYNVNGGGSSEPAAQTGVIGAVISVTATIPTRTGYTFSNWNTNSDGTGTTYASSASFTMPEGGDELFAQWTANPASLVYDANGGSGAPSTTSSSTDASVSVSSTVPTRAGYTFTGWNTASNGSGTSYPSGATLTMPSGGVTLYAQWVADAYLLVYDANGGSGEPASQVATTGSTVTVSSTTPSRSGYTFGSWNTKANGTGTDYLGASTFAMPPSDTTLYAQWTANTYVVTYNPNGGSGGLGTAVSSTGATVTVSSTNPTRTGYTFLGWSSTPEGPDANYTAGGTFTMPASDVTLYAQWTAVSYTLSYNANGGAGAPASSTVNYAATATVSATVPTRAGYWFNGWNTASGGSGTSYAASTSFTMLGNVQLYALWVPNINNLAYNANGGINAPGDSPQATGSTVTAAAQGSMSREGYTLAGWNTNADGTGTSYAAGTGTFTMPASNTTLYAKWTPVNYTVTYDANFVTVDPVPDPQTATYLSTVTVEQPTSLSRSGYTFTGWNTLANGTGTGYASDGILIMPAENVTLYAQWFANTNAIIYNANGGSGAPANGSATTSSTATVSSTIPTRAGYTFGGWAKSSGGSVAAGGTFTMPASSVTLVAIWTAIDYTVTYNANGGSGAPSSQVQATDSLVTVSSTAPTRSACTFVSWNTASDGSGTSYAPGASFEMPASNRTLFARWNCPSSDSGGGGSTGQDSTTPANKDVTTSTSQENIGSSEVTETLVALVPTNVKTPPDEPVTVMPITTAPPAGQTWVESSVRIIDPSTGRLSTKVETRQGTWTVDTTTGEVTFSPRPGFRGTASVQFRVLTSARLTFRSGISVNISGDEPSRLRQLSTTVYFPSLSSTLSPDAKRQVKGLVKRVNIRGKLVRVVVVGYVQPVGGVANDMSLSRARAVSTGTYLRDLGVKSIQEMDGLGRANEPDWKARRAKVTIAYTPR